MGIAKDVYDIVIRAGYSMPKIPIFKNSGIMFTGQSLISMCRLLNIKDLSKLPVWRISDQYGLKKAGKKDVGETKR